MVYIEQIKHLIYIRNKIKRLNIFDIIIRK